MAAWRLGACTALLVACGSFGSSGSDDAKDSGSAGTNPGNAACAGKHTLCLSFDQGAPALPWNVANLGTTATIVSAPEPTVSPPSALRAGVSASAGSAYPVVSVPLPPSTKHIRCAAQFDITEVSTLGGVTVLRVLSATGTSFVELGIEPSYLKVDTSAGGHELSSLQTNRYAEIGIEVSTTGTGSITYTGPGGPAQFPLPAPLADVEFTRADFGLVPNGSATTWTAYFDDLYCDVLP